MGYIDSDVSHRFPWLLYSVLSIDVRVRQPSVINKTFYSIVSEFFLTLLFLSASVTCLIVAMQICKLLIWFFNE